MVYKYPKILFKQALINGLFFDIKSSISKNKRLLTDKYILLNLVKKDFKKHNRLTTIFDRHN